MTASEDCTIEAFRPEHAEAFAVLNRAWLVEYGLLEQPDERQLADPCGEIITRGGQIFVALRGREVVGTCAALPHGPGVVELVKLTVSPREQGRGLGRLLVEANLAYARERGARRVILVSSSRLQPAVGLYQALGFQHRPMPPDVPYATADVYMELDLTPAAASLAADDRPA